MKPYSLYYVNFPAGCNGEVYGITKLKPDGSYIVAIDAAQDEQTQAHALRHELAHIYLKHLEPETAGKTIQEVEREADEYADKMTEKELEYLLSFCRKREVKPPAFMEEYERKKVNAQPA